MDFIVSTEIQSRIKTILQKLNLPHLDHKRIIGFISYGSKSKAYARIWSLPTIWQKALQVKAHYCVEVIWEKFNKLNHSDQTKVLIHELMHIPKTFSGALLPHKGRGRIRINKHAVDKIYNKYFR